MDRKLNQGELIAGLAVVAIGLAVVAIGSSYPLGTITRMGPGYAPIALGIVLSVLGGAICFEARSAERNSIDFAWQPFVFIMGGILIWALTVTRFGLVPATFLLALCCANVEKGRTVTSMLATATALCVIGYLIFIRGLNLPLVAFRL